MQQLSELNAIVAECDRISKGMLNGSMTRDDGLFAAAATLQKVATEFAQFVSYALPILHTIDQAMRMAAQTTQAAQAAQAAQTQSQAAQVQVAQAPGQVEQALAQATPPPAMPSLSIRPSTEIQLVDGAPGGRR